MAPLSLRNDDMTDRELLHVVHEEAAVDADGYASSHDIGVALGFKENGKDTGPARKVSTRLGWMARPEYGFLVHAPDDRTLWKLTELGHDLMNGRLTMGVEAAISRMDPGQQLLVMRQVSREGMVEGSRQVGTALRREFQNNYAKTRRNGRKRS